MVVGGRRQCREEVWGGSIEGRRRPEEGEGEGGEQSGECGCERGEVREERGVPVLEQKFKSADRILNRNTI